MSEPSQSWLNRILSRTAAGPDSIPDVVPCDDPAMMNRDEHKEVMANASDYIDGEADSNLTSKIRQHLGICADCNGWVRSLAATVGLVRAIPDEPVPESLRARIRNLPGD